VRTPEEIQAAAETFAWYAATGRWRILPYDQQGNFAAVCAAIEWANGDRDPHNPIAVSLREIAAIRKEATRAAQN
jgi:hypothetical protein